MPRMSDASAKSAVLYALVVMVITWHAITTYFEEKLFKGLNFELPWFMILVMCALYCLLYMTFMYLAKPKKARAALELLYQQGDKSIRRNMFWLCMLYIVSNCLSKMALEYVSIPTQIVFKSCKLVAVMIGSSFILGKTYTREEYVIAAALVAGMCLFAGGDLKGGLESMSHADYRTWMGLLILCGALTCDSLLGNLQEKVQKTTSITETDLMFVQSAFGCGALSVWCTVSGELASGIRLCYENNQVLFALLPWAICNMLGIVMLLKIVGDYSAVAAVLTSFVRKVVSLLFSYFFFPKRLTVNHLLGFVLVFGAMGAHSWYKQGQKSDSHNQTLKRLDSEDSTELDTLTSGVDSPPEDEVKHTGEQQA